MLIKTITNFCWVQWIVLAKKGGGFFSFYVTILHFSLFQNRMFCFKTVIWDQRCLNWIQKYNKNKTKLTDSKLKHFLRLNGKVHLTSDKILCGGSWFFRSKKKKHPLTIHSALIWSFGSAGFWQSSQLQSLNPNWKFSMLWGVGGEKTGGSKGERRCWKKLKMTNSKSQK